MKAAGRRRKRRMFRTSALAVFLALCVGWSCTPGAFAAEASNPSPPSPKHGGGIQQGTVVTIHGKIVSVDRVRKLVTLKGPDGNEVTIKVLNPYNLAAAHPGEPFVARFRDTVTVRRKQPGEALAAMSVQEGVTTAAPGETPGGTIHSKSRVVVTVSAINLKDKSVTIKGPDGSEEAVAVANPQLLKKVKEGDQLVVTSKQKIAISLDKE
jgi:hypothetical protein